MSGCDCIPEEHEHCTECDAPVFPSRAVWLELSIETGEYTLPGKIPAIESQGGFPFGRDCAKKVMR